MSNEPIIAMTDLSLEFEGGRVKALDGVSMEVMPGEFVAIVGPSGCGKSTLLHLIAALEKPTRGAITVRGHDLLHYRDLNEYRARDVGIVFQLDNLLPSLTASENVQVPMLGQGLNGKDRHRRAEELLARVGLAGRVHERPPRLSGGERQRVAIARALANNPGVLLADEPTGRLDSKSGAHILDLLEELRAQSGVTIVLVTHDQNVAARADRIVQMLDGRIINDTQTGARAAMKGALRMKPVLTYRMPLALKEADPKVREALKAEGFGILTEVDVTATLREKLGAETIPYRILGACNPALAHQAMGIEPQVGAFLPCGLAMYEATPGETTIALQNPALMASVFSVPGLEVPADAALLRLTKALATVAEPMS